jgi:hypothetical protein
MVKLRFADGSTRRIQDFVLDRSGEEFEPIEVGGNRFKYDGPPTMGRTTRRASAKSIPLSSP